MSVADINFEPSSFVINSNVVTVTLVHQGICKCTNIGDLLSY